MNDIEDEKLTPVELCFFTPDSYNMRWAKTVLVADVPAFLAKHQIPEQAVIDHDEETYEIELPEDEIRKLREACEGPIDWDRR